MVYKEENIKFRLSILVLKKAKNKRIGRKLGRGTNN